MKDPDKKHPPLCRQQPTNSKAFTLTSRNSDVRIVGGLTTKQQNTKRKEKLKRQHSTAPAFAQGKEFATAAKHPSLANSGP